MSVLWDCAVTVVIIPREHSAVPVPPAWNSPLEEDPVEVQYLLLCCFMQLSSYRSQMN